MKYLTAAAISLAAFTLPALAQDSTAPQKLAPLTKTTSDISPVITRTYLCERGARVPAVYINDSTPQRVVLMLEGRMVVMSHIASADGAKYAEDGEGAAGYVWWTKGSGAMLDWVAEDGESQTLLSGCEEE